MKWLDVYQSVKLWTELPVCEKHWWTGDKCVQQFFLRGTTWWAVLRYMISYWLRDFVETWEKQRMEDKYSTERPSDPENWAPWKFQTEHYSNQKVWGITYMGLSNHRRRAEKGKSVMWLCWTSAHASYWEAFPRFTTHRWQHWNPGMMIYKCGGQGHIKGDCASKGFDDPERVRIGDGGTLEVVGVGDVPVRAALKEPLKIIIHVPKNGL